MGNKTKFYYKVVDSDYNSVSIHTSNPYCLHYELNKEVKGYKGTGIFIFKSLRETREFAGFTHKILKVEAVNPKSTNCVAFLEGSFFPTKQECIEAFWFHPEKRQILLAPKGTYVADSIIPREFLI